MPDDPQDTTEDPQAGDDEEFVIEDIDAGDDPKGGARSVCFVPPGPND